MSLVNILSSVPRKFALGAFSLCLTVSGCSDVPEKPVVQEKNRTADSGLFGLDLNREEKRKMLGEAVDAVEIFKENPSDETLKIAEEKFYSFFEKVPDNNSVSFTAAPLFYADGDFHKKLMFEINDRLLDDEVSGFIRGKLHNHLATLISHAAVPPSKEDAELIASWKNYRVQAPDRVKKGLVKEAEIHYTAAIRLLEPESLEDADSVSIFGLAELYKNAGMNREAISVLAKTVEREEISQRSLTYYRLGSLSEKIGDIKNTKEFYRLAIESDSESEFTKFGIWSYVRLGEICLKEGNLEDAETFAGEVLRIYQKDELGVDEFAKVLPFIYLVADKKCQIAEASKN